MHSFIDPLIYSVVGAFVRSSFHSFIHLCDHLLVYSFVQCTSHFSGLAYACLRCPDKSQTKNTTQVVAPRCGEGGQSGRGKRRGGGGGGRGSGRGSRGGGPTCCTVVPAYTEQLWCLSGLYPTPSSGTTQANASRWVERGERGGREGGGS